MGSGGAKENRAESQREGHERLARRGGGAALALLLGRGRRADAGQRGVAHRAGDRARAGIRHRRHHGESQALVTRDESGS